MEPDAVTVRGELTLEEATASLRGRKGLPEQLTSIFVVDRDNVLLGVLPLARLLLGEPGVKVAAVNTLNRAGKARRTRFGTGKRKDTKRAIVTLKSGSIDIFTAVG